MKIKVIFMVLLSVLCCSSVSAQKNNKKITIKGTVLDVSKTPIRNAIIMIDGNNTSSTTDAEGKYTIKVKPKAITVGVFTFGNGIMEEPINGRTQIDFNFGTVSIQTPLLNNEAGEVGVDVGYGTVKQKNLTNQVNKIDGTDKKYTTYTSVYEMIQRQVSGVRVNGTSVIIQGSKDFFGEVPALLVVDGVPVTSVSDIQPSTVKSIEVLKGSAAAMYGTRGYGGVILIKTKSKND